MKKILSIVCLLLGTSSLMAQQTFNLFPASDVDKNGWLWFDTQEKIDKYVGLIDEENYRLDMEGKIVQMIYADQIPDYPETMANPYAVGVGVNAEYGEETSRTGAIILAPSTQQMSTNGGGIALKLPSCSTISMYLSSEGRMLGRTLSTSDPTYDFNRYWPVCIKAVTGFMQLHGAGVFAWEGIETANNCSDHPDFTFVSDGPTYFYFQNCNAYPLYIHGIKVTTPKNEVVEDDPLLGDANEDKNVDVADITAIASYILGQNPSPFNKKNADVDTDNNITVADITGTASIILK